MKFSTVSDSLTTRAAALVGLLLNILSIFFGINYLISSNTIWIRYSLGGLVVITLFYNDLLGDANLSKQKTRYIRDGVYVYLTYSNLAMWMIFLGLFMGFAYPTVQENLLIYILIYTGFFSIFIYGIVLCALYCRKEELNVDKKIGQGKSSKFRIITKKILLIVCYLSLILMICIDYTLLDVLTFIGFILGVFAGMAGIFFGLNFFSGLITLLHLRDSTPRASDPKKNQKQTKIILLVGLCSTLICFLPLISTPIFIQTAEQNFSKVFNPHFGGDYKKAFSQKAGSYQQYFMAQPWGFGEYFLGLPDPQCEQRMDVFYFNGSLSNFAVDKPITLYFNAYLPLNRGLASDSTPLPGHNSTLIRIHGGSWMLGDKGLGNMLMMNKYFAQQGYCVFDIQYGLNNKSGNSMPFLTPNHVMGPFTIDDMMRHVGNFTQFLIAHQADYGANLSSVFISGGSAGGQLTCATALGIASGNYIDIFGTGLIIKAMIPFYPANAADTDFVKIGKPEWYNPELLVTSTSPPCLLYQGYCDPLIARTRSLIETYQQHGNTACGAIYFPFAGHASDLSFPAYYNQVFLYYMERFMFLYQ